MSRRRLKPEKLRKPSKKTRMMQATDAPYVGESVMLPERLLKRTAPKAPAVPAKLAMLRKAPAYATYDNAANSKDVKHE